MEGEKLTDRSSLLAVQASDNLEFYVVDKDDTSQSPEGSSFKVNKSELKTILGLNSGGLNEDVIINIGNIGVQNIQDYINANDNVNWDLKSGPSYFFKTIKNGLTHTYLYVGEKPKYMGDSQPGVAYPGDFNLISATKLVIEESEVVKANSNASEVSLQANDEVFSKKLTNNGDPVFLPYGVYQGGDTSLRDNYVSNYSVDA